MNAAISAFLAERIAANDFPSAVYLVAEKGEILFQDALGYAVVEPERIPARLDTIYDVASLTKVLVTAILVARLVERNVLNLDDDVVRILASTETLSSKGKSLLQLVTHTSGYDAWKPFYLLVNAPEFDSDDYGCASGNNDAIREFVQEQILNSVSPVDGVDVIYSDLNFILLGFLVELLYGSPISTILLSEMTERLQLLRTSYYGSGTLCRETAASEFGNEYEKQTCIDRSYLQPPATAGGSDRHSAFRDRLIWGEVHDGNAYFMGGAAGHAGLFSTAEEVFKIALQFLPGYTRLLKPETCGLFRTNFTKGMNEDRSFAFQLASTEGSTAGTKMSPESFGHNGFTGTSLWIDPVKERVFVLLTNRTHNHPLPFVNINSVRRRFHDLAIEQLESLG